MVRCLGLFCWQLPAGTWTHGKKLSNVRLMLRKFSDDSGWNGILCETQHSWYTTHVDRHKLAMPACSAVVNTLNKPVFSFLRILYADNVTLPAFACRCCWAPAVQQSIDISCPTGQQQQAYSSGFAVVMGPHWARQTDGHYHCVIDPGPHTMLEPAGSVHI